MTTYTETGPTLRTARLGVALQVVGIIGLVVMVAAIGVTIHQTVDIDNRADDVLLPMSGGLEDLDAQLATVSQLWVDILEAIPAESTEDLAETVTELTATLERAGELIETARRGLEAVDGIPFLPVDTAEMMAQLGSLEESLAFVLPLLEEASVFLSADEAGAQDVIDGVSSGLIEIGVGLDAAQSEVASISGAVDRWLVAGTGITLLLLLWGIAGQIGLIVLGSRMRGADEPVVVTP